MFMFMSSEIHSATAGIEERQTKGEERRGSRQAKCAGLRFDARSVYIYKSGATARKVEEG